MAPGATLSVGTNVSVLILGGQTITDNGTLSFATGDSVTFGYVYDVTTAIVVNGVMNSSGDSFSAASLNGNSSFSQIAVESAGELIATTSGFSLSQLYFYNSSVMKSGDLTGDSFNLPTSSRTATCSTWAGTRASSRSRSTAVPNPSGTLNLNEIGTNTSNLSYVFIRASQWRRERR